MPGILESTGQHKRGHSLNVCRECMIELEQYLKESIKCCIILFNILSSDMSETAYIDELLKAEQAANEIIQNAQK